MVRVKSGIEGVVWGWGVGGVGVRLCVGWGVEWETRFGKTLLKSTSLFKCCMSMTTNRS